MGYKEAISHTLREHCRPLEFFGIRFTWLGIHKLYRLILVANSTYITEPTPRILVMTSSLMVITVANAIMKPYKNNAANVTAILSYAANLCVAMVNLWKTALVTLDCKTNCSMKDTLLWYFGFEKFLLVYLPVAVLFVFVIFRAICKCFERNKLQQKKVC